MFCRQVQRLLPGFVLQQLDSGTCRKLEAHITACDPCRKALSESLELDDLLSAVPMPIVSENFAGRVVASALETTPPRAVGRTAWISAAAVACMIVVVGWAGFRIGENYQKAATQSGVIQTSLSAPIEPAF